MFPLFFFSTISVKGIIGIYFSFIYILARLIRDLTLRDRMIKVQFDEIPNADLILTTIYNINLARELKDYWLEEELVAKLIFIMRCPDVLFSYSRIQKNVPIYSIKFRDIVEGELGLRSRRLTRDDSYLQEV